MIANSLPAARAAHRRASRSADHGLVLLAVLVVVTIAAMVASTALYFADAQGRSAAHTLRSPQSRAAAWSGVQAAMAELAAQRDALLQGAAPKITADGVVDGPATGDGPRWVYRLVASGPDVAVSETAKLDVNTATAEMLARIPGIDPPLAARIVSRRDAGPLFSLNDLLGVDGITPELLLGPARPTDHTDPASPGPLRDLLTVFSFDPDVQSAIAPPAGGDSGSLGERRLRLTDPWSDELDRTVEHRFGRPIADVIKKLMQATPPAKSDSDLVTALRAAAIPAAQWPAVLDGFTALPDEYRVGRVDLLRAPAVVLACIPGIDQAAADRIVQARTGLDDASRRTPAWPLLAGILTEDQFIAAVNFITVRSLQWRVVVEAGFQPSIVTGGQPTARSDTTADGSEHSPPLHDRVILEAVIDVASQRPRVAYLRDVTLRPVAAVLASAAPPDQPETPQPPPEEPPAPAPPSPESAPIPPTTPEHPVASPEPAITGPDYRPASPIRADQGGTSLPLPRPATDNRLGRWTVGPHGGPS